MKTKALLLLALLPAAPAAAQSFGNPVEHAYQYVPSPNGPSASKDDIVVFMKAGGDIGNLAASAGVDVVESIPSKEIHLVRPGPLTRAQLAHLLAELGGDPSSLYAELNRRAQPPESACLPFGQVVPQQCTIGVVDGTPTSAEYFGQPAVLSIQAAAAQAISLGLPSVVAVIDTGIDPTHVVFQGRLFGPGWDFVANRPGGVDVPNGRDDDLDGLVDEAYGHGTHVAGTVALVNPHALILPIRVMDADGNGTAFDVAQGIFYAVESGAHVINLSLSMLEASFVVSAALAYAEQHGVRVFTSAGNTGSEQVLFPGNYIPILINGVQLPFILSTTLTGVPIYAVAAVDAYDVLAPFSAYGNVDFCAPGVDVYSAVPGGGFAWWSGTSMACAVASGAASLVVSSWDGELPEMEAGAVLQMSADPIQSFNPGFDGKLGTGRVNALNALTLLESR